MTYITGKILPDLDAVACAIAYSKYLKIKDPTQEFTPVFETDINFESKYVLDKLNIKSNIVLGKNKYNPNLMNANFIMVDFSGTLGLPTFVEKEKVNEVIDRRDFPEYESFPKAKWRIDKVGAAATIIAEFYFFDKFVELEPTTATLLLTAIYSNTVNFKSSNTTFRDFRMRDYLSTISDNPSLPIEMLEYKSNYILQNLESVLLEEKKNLVFQNGETFSIYQVETSKAEEIISSSQSIIKRIGEIDINLTYNYLLIQDESLGRTVIISNDPSQMELFESVGLPGKQIDNYWQIDKIMMRKLIVPYFMKMR